MRAFSISVFGRRMANILEHPANANSPYSHRMRGMVLNISAKFM